MDLAEIVKANVDYDHRRGAVEGLWAVVMVDGINDDREAAIAELVEDHLGLARADSEEAKARAVIP